MYDEFLRDKRVALVGPASSTELMKIGPLIDSYDLVARVGNYYDLVLEETGTRTDILCENFWFWDGKTNIDEQGLYDYWLSQGLKYVNHVWPNNHGLDRFKDINKGRVKITMQSDPMIKSIRNKIRSPTKGICTMLDFITRPFKELFLVGFSCSRGFYYRHGYLNNRFRMPPGDQEYIDPVESSKELSKWCVNTSSWHHHLDEEFNIMKQVASDKRVTTDEWLTKILCV